MESEMKEMYNKSMEELCKLADDYRVKLDTVSDVFEELSDDEKIEIIFDYLDEQGEERPFSMDEFDDEMRGFTPSDIAMRITEDFNIQDEYFWFNGYGNVESGDAYEVIDKFADDVSIDWLKENFNRYTAFNDFADELDDMRDVYDDIVNDMEEEGIDVLDIPSIEEEE